MSFLSILNVPVAATCFTWLVRFTIAKLQKTSWPTSYYGASGLVAFAVSILVTTIARFGPYSVEGGLGFVFVVLALFTIDTRMQLGKHARLLNEQNKEQFYEYPDYSLPDMLWGASLSAVITLLMLMMEGSLRLS